MISFLPACEKQFKYYKQLAEKAMEQVSDEDLFDFGSEHFQSNSIAVIIGHLIGNIKSRWTDFRTSDGEKSWRNRDREFEDQYLDRKTLLVHWEEAWNILFRELNLLNDELLETTVYIRNMGHTITEALQRQLCHLAYHVGQVVYVAKEKVGKEWVSLSIPKGESQTYNRGKFLKEKRRSHFTDEFLDSED